MTPYKAPQDTPGTPYQASKQTMPQVNADKAKHALNFEKQ